MASSWRRELERHSDATLVGRPVASAVSGNGGLGPDHQHGGWGVGKRLYGSRLFPPAADSHSVAGLRTMLQLNEGRTDPAEHVATPSD